MSSIRERASELVRESILSGDPCKLHEMIARLTLFEMYDKPDDSVLVDDENRVIRFAYALDDDIFDPEMPPGADVVVFVRDDQPVGWLPKHQFDQIPERFAGLSADYLFKMPVDWDFIERPCRRIPCTSSAVWDYYAEAWDCFHCPRYNFDEHVRRQDD